MTDPQPLSTSSDDVWQNIRGVFTDIDDTITTNGRITADVFAAMERLRDAGLLCVPITGRPAGWCDMIARQWPVDAVVGENGAFYFRYDEGARQMIRSYADDADERAEKAERLQRVRKDILAEVPGAAVSADQPFRMSDLAIDFCEDVSPLDQSEVRRIVEIFERHGATAKVSSIHVNGWFGDFDKLTMTKRMMAEQFAVDLSTDAHAFTFVGDSPNDAPMFRFFPNAVGVANLREFLDQCDALPAWITAHARGAGFVEFADRILALK
ncbi:MAG: HAD-IIB family hydrolase [Hyphomicrobiaceae bacterium]|nr:HAD-IIB family hydrolase [Hyphomicrobiaceae bacterium]